MKILLLLASVIAVFSTDSPDFPDHPDGGATATDGLGFTNQDHTGTVESQTYYTEVAQSFPERPVFRNSEFEDQRMKDGSGFFNDESQLLDLSEEDGQIMKEGKSRTERGLRDSQCEANVICGILGGSCISNNTVCSGWLVSEGCKGTNCKCCIPGSLEMKMKNFGLELQSLKDELASASQQQTMELKSMIANITNTNAGLKGQIQSFTNSKINASLNFESQLNNLTNVNAELNEKLHSIEADISRQGCPEGLFWFASSDQCFQLLNTTTCNWETANQKCSELGLVLAKPYEPVSLRHFLIAKYGLTTDSWVGAQGAGSSTKWIRDGQAIATNSILWYSGYDGKKSSSSCLVLATHPSHQTAYPNAPYFTNGCSAKYWAVCEYVRE